MSGAEGNSGFGGFSNGPGSAAPGDAAIGAAEIASGAYADTVPDDRTADEIDISGRSLVERAAGWVGDKVQGKIDSVMNNPIGALVNAALGLVPGVGMVNSLSGLIGGPTLGAAVPGIMNAMSEGRVDPQTPDTLAGFTGNTFDEYNDWNAGQVRYYRLRDGSIINRVVKNSPDGSVQALNEGVRATV